MMLIQHPILARRVPTLRRHKGQSVQHVYFMMKFSSQRDVFERSAGLWWFTGAGKGQVGGRGPHAVPVSAQSGCEYYPEVVLL